MSSLSFPAANRRRFLQSSAALAASFSSGVQSITGQEPRKAQVAITLDLEMSRHYPRWDDMHWDYEKGNLDQATKDYAREACRRIKQKGGVAHLFAVGRVFEQENVDWLREIVRAGHAVGNHTYDHVYVLATEPEQLQFRFQRAPWLIYGKRPQEVIRENIVLTNLALRECLGIAPAGFRTPGGFANGLRDRIDVQQLLLDLGFTWVSSLYPPHPNSKPGEEPSEEVFEGIVAANAAAQPFVYPTGLKEIPMSPVSDVNAFRTGRWSLSAFKQAVRLGIEWAIEQGGVYDFLTHPSCLVVADPKFETIEMICDLVADSRGRAELVTLDKIAADPRRFAVSVEKSS